MRSLQIGIGWFPEDGGGLERYYFEMGKALPLEGIHSSGLVVASSQVQQSSGGGVRAFAQLGTPLLGRMSGIRRAVREELADGAFDVVAGHFALYVFPVLGLIRKLPFVMHFHGPWAAEKQLEGGNWKKGLAQRALERLVYQRADLVITLSDAFKQILIDDYGLKEQKIRVVSGGLDTRRYDVPETRQEARQILGWPVDRPIVLAVRRLTHRMGLSNLIAAVDVLRRSVPDVLVLIAGRGHLVGELQSQIRSSGLENHVRLLGFIPDSSLPLAYRSADITVLPTLALEGFGLSAAESLAAGTPALVTPVGGLPEVVRELSQDLILSGTGIDILAEGMAGLLSGRVALPSAERCRDHCRDRFDWDVAGPGIRSIYAEATGAIKAGSRALVARIEQRTVKIPHHDGKSGKDTMIAWGALGSKLNPAMKERA